jgi:hypothetical protein
MHLKIIALSLLLSLNINTSASINYYKYDFFPSRNLLGQVGIIQLPSAEIDSAGSLNFQFQRNDMYRSGSLSIQPFNWLEASYFYYRPNDLWWTGPGTEGQYLDKGFNLKIAKKISNNTFFAIGLDDFAGTGLFSKEYVVSTHTFNWIKASLGIGWGAFADINGFRNPLSYISNSFLNRDDVSENFRFAGNLSYDQWFRGPANLFFGSEFSIPNTNFLIKFEYDPFSYLDGYTTLKRFTGQDFELRRKSSNINLGLSKNFSNYFEAGIYYLKGNQIALNFSIKADFSKSLVTKKINTVKVSSSNKGKSITMKFYEDLLFNLQKESIFVQTASIDEKDANIKVAVASSKHRNPIRITKIVNHNVSEIERDLKSGLSNVTVIGTNVGLELYRLKTYLPDNQNSNINPTELVIRNAVIEPGKQDEFQQFEFKPIIRYPASFTGATPALVNHIGDPRQFYYGGVILRIDNELQFSSRLQLNTEIHQNITNNFDEKRNFPDSLLPRVRTDIVSYLQESDTYISRMQLDYFFSLYKEIFGKFSAGILENMYAGAGVEFLYKPFEQNFSVGLEAYRAKKRSFDRKFDLLDYEINTGHINFNYHLPQFGILGTLSYGKYLAGDEGYTFDISRRLSSGFRAGIFFTRTNVSAELFGEGSFDKGFYFQIPIDLFLNDYRGGYINFKLRPLTRDGGQKLEAGNDLIGIMHTTSRAEIERDWRSFND